MPGSRLDSKQGDSTAVAPVESQASGAHLSPASTTTRNSGRLDEGNNDNASVSSTYGSVVALTPAGHGDVQSNLKAIRDRIKQVDAQLDKLGHFWASIDDMLSIQKFEYDVNTLENRYSERSNISQKREWIQRVFPAICEACEACEACEERPCLTDDARDLIQYVVKDFVNKNPNAADFEFLIDLAEKHDLVSQTLRSEGDFVNNVIIKLDSRHPPGYLARVIGFGMTIGPQNLKVLCERIKNSYSEIIDISQKREWINQVFPAICKACEKRWFLDDYAKDLIQYVVNDFVKEDLNVDDFEFLLDLAGNHRLVAQDLRWEHNFGNKLIAKFDSDENNYNAPPKYMIMAINLGIRIERQKLNSLLKSTDSSKISAKTLANIFNYYRRSDCPWLNESAISFLRKMQPDEVGVKYLNEYFKRLNPRIDLVEHFSSTVNPIKEAIAEQKFDAAPNDLDILLLFEMLIIGSEPLITFNCDLVEQRNEIIAYFKWLAEKVSSYEKIKHHTSSSEAKKAFTTSIIERAEKYNNPEYLYCALNPNTIIGKILWESRLPSWLPGKCSLDSGNLNQVLKALKKLVRYSDMEEGSKSKRDFDDRIEQFQRDASKLEEISKKKCEEIIPRVFASIKFPGPIESQVTSIRSANNELARSSVRALINSSASMLGANNLSHAQSQQSGNGTNNAVAVVTTAIDTNNDSTAASSNTTTVTEYNDQAYQATLDTQADAADKHQQGFDGMFEL